MKLLSVVGARPQFVKLAPVDRAIVKAGHEHFIVHTGQHYDRNMSDVFFEELSIPEPHVNLSIGSSNHGAQTGAMLAGLEEVLLAQQPDSLVVYGDTNSTLAAALAAVKQDIHVSHVEAGLRSFNREMPEEHNRVLTDHCADVLLAPTEVAVAHLAAEGLSDRTRLVGDVMVDVFRAVERVVEKAPSDRGQLVAGIVGDFYLATIHRQESTDDPAFLGRILDGLASLDAPVLLAAHPRLIAKCDEAGIALTRGAIVARSPLSYREMVEALKLCKGVVTDSGGLQKEAFLAGRVCTTIRGETEWVETLASGWNVLAGDLTDLSVIAGRQAPAADDSEPYGSGNAGDRVVQAIVEHLRS